MAANGGDGGAHEATYHSFTGIVKISTIICALLAAFVVWLIAG